MKKIVETPEWQEYVESNNLTENVRYGEEFRTFLGETQRHLRGDPAGAGRDRLTGVVGRPPAACARRPHGPPEGTGMRLAFTAAILCLAVLYTYWAFAELSFLSSTGRLGPGFFPRIVGLLLIVACLLTLAGDLKKRRRRRRSRATGGPPWSSPACPAPSSSLLEILGGPLAMVVYMLATLLVLNPGRYDAERRDQHRPAARAVPAVRRLAERVDAAGCPRAAVVSGGRRSSAPGRRRAG